MKGNIRNFPKINLVKEKNTHLVKKGKTKLVILN